jgi:hypothetical protein
VVEGGREAGNIVDGVLKHALMLTVRYGIAAALIVAGQVVLIADNGPRGAGLEGWALFTGAGLAVLLLNLLFRMGVEGDRDREREENARRYFDEHGHWPD